VAVSLCACSSKSGTSSSADQNQSSKEVSLQAGMSGSGNGEYYGGKPQPGLYLREVPNTGCASSPTVLGEVRVSETEATEKLVDPKTCKVSFQTVKFDQLSYASYFTGRVGHIEGIYSKKTQQNAGTMEEAWCRGVSSTINTGFDVMIRADYTNRIWQAFVVSAKPDRNGVIVRKEHPAITIQDRRFRAGERIRYKVEEQFEIDIEVSALNPWAGTMRAEFKYNINGFDAEQWLDCRLGGIADLGTN
jgi:hypothetical protein